MKATRGFSLLEMMIAITVIGIIASLAIPSYQSHIVKTKRAEAMAALESFATAMAAYYANNGGSYLGAGVNGGEGIAVFGSQVPVDGGSAYYRLSLSNLSRGSFQLSATPEDGSSQQNDGVLTLDQSGNRSWNGQAYWPH